MLFEHNNKLKDLKKIILKVIQDSARSSEKGGIELLKLLMRGGEVLVTKDIIEAAVIVGQSSKFIAWLLDQDADIEVTENILQLAALQFNTNVLRYLHKQEPELKVTPKMLALTAINNYTKEVLKALLEIFNKPRIPVQVL